MSNVSTKLSVNLNAVAYLRNRRSVPWPDLIAIARLVLDAGAHGITVHPRPDQRHIRFSDVADLARLLAEDYPTAEFNIEGYPSAQFTELVHSVRAHQVTLVPDAPDQSTSDHGWDFSRDGAMLANAARGFRAAGLRVAFFVEANTEDPFAAWSAGADRVEFYTGSYGAQRTQAGARRTLDALAAAAAVARQTGHNNAEGRAPLRMNAGHDLTAQNLPALVAAVPDLAEVSIGHGITAEALLVGFPEAVRRYLAALCQDAGSGRP